MAELTEDARTKLRALHSGEGIPEAALGLLDLLRRTDLPAAADHDDAMLVFCESRLFNAQSQGVQQRIIDELERHTQLADESEMPDVRTVLEDALPADVRGWLRLVRQQHLGPELGTLLHEIREQVVGDELIEQRIEEFKKRIGLEALLPSCCCCGIRDDYILERDLEIIRARAGVRKPAASSRPASGAVPRAPRDLYTERGPPKSSYVKMHLQHKVLKRLRLEPEDEAKHQRDVNGQYYSIFEDVQPGQSSAFYYLIPGLVDTTSVPGETTVILCRS
jgi:hypothetical protein